LNRAVIARRTPNPYPAAGFAAMWGNRYTNMELPKEQKKAAMKIAA